MKYAKLATANIPQSEPLDDQQVENNAGGYVYAIDDWARLDRFLILGSEAPTYYQKAQNLTRENAKCVMRCYDADAERTVARIVEISDKGRAPKNDPAIFALAIGASHADVKVRQLALRELPKVCRIGTHLFQFVAAVRTLGRGWGRTLKRAVANWYDNRKVEDVAYQAIKYRQRENYIHKRMLQSAHPAGDKTKEREALYRWICGKEFDPEALPVIVGAHLAAMDNPPAKKLIKLVKDYKLPWEALPTEANANPDIWKAMLPDMGLTALIRNLGNMSRVGVFTPLGKNEEIAVKRINDEKALRKSRVHPFTVLQAMAVYASGHGLRGSGEWKVSRPVVDALDNAFYKAFANVGSTGKRIFIGLDVSGSMSSSLGGSALTVAQAAAAMAMVTMRTEDRWHVTGFADGLRDLKLNAKDSLESAVCKTANLPFDSTDCALPMIYAMQKGIEADAFMVITDNETWAGNIHPARALKDYRKKTGIPAKLVVMGMTSTGFSIADPDDGGMLDVIGMDASVPVIVIDFILE